MFDMDEDDVFVGSPRSKFYDIIHTANKNLVADEIDMLIERYLVLEIMAEQKGVDVDNIHNIAKSYCVSNASEVESRKMSLYMDLTANIVTRNE